MGHGQSPMHPGDPHQDSGPVTPEIFSPAVSETLLTPTLTSSMFGGAQLKLNLSLGLRLKSRVQADKQT